MKLRLLPAIFAAGILIGFPAILSAEEGLKKVIFISGKPSHGPMAHEHRAGNILLAKRLKEADLGIDPIVLPDIGYPEDSSVLDGAATVVVFCTGHRNHLLNPNLEEFDALMKKGTGVVMIHWATEAEIGMPGKKFLEWMGGFCDLNWSVNPHWAPDFETFPDHPVANGLTPFSLNDEWYYHMRFVEGMKGVTPILSALPGPETLKRPDGDRSGNPHVRKAVANGESQHVAWTYDRPEGKGRGFGFTGAHNHKSWQNDNFRKVVLNAILWTAHVDVPEEGVPSATPDEAELKLNLDDKSKRKKAAPPKPKVSPPASDDRQDAAATFQRLRKEHVKSLDSSASLELLAKALGTTADSGTQSALLLGMIAGLEGRRNVAAPESWRMASKGLSQSSNAEVKLLVGRVSQIFGDKGAIERAYAMAGDDAASSDDRRDALRSLVTQKHPKLGDLLAKLLDDPDLQKDAIRAYRNIESGGAPALLLKRYATLNDDSKRVVIETLATRKSSAVVLVKALKEGAVSREAIPAYIARALSTLLGKGFTDVYGDIEALSKDKVELIARYKALLTSEKLEKADASRGRLVFQMSCAACHVLYGEGGIIGPDLTGSNRADIDYILLNMIDPSADIPDAYKMVTIKTKGGQFLSGTITEEDDQRVVLNMIGQKLTVVKSDVATREVSPFSMMPEGLLPTIQDAQVLDLVKYLQTSKQVGLPK